MSIKPILFNTEMVQAILEGRKTVTRRKVDAKTVEAVLNSPARIGNPELSDQQFIECLCTAPYRPGDILWVRETWRMQNYGFDYDTRTYQGQELQYRADLTDGEDECYGRRGGCAPCRWSPSIHMPREAARLFLRVKSVLVERLQEITPIDCVREGVERTALEQVGGAFTRGIFHDIWESTIEPADLPRYGWDANPWIYVIEFERIAKDEAMQQMSGIKT